MSPYHSVVRLLAAMVLAVLLVSLLGAAVAEVGNDTTHHARQPGENHCFLAPHCSMASDCVKTCPTQTSDGYSALGRKFGGDLPAPSSAQLHFQPAVIALQKPPPKLVSLS